MHVWEARERHLSRLSQLSRILHIFRIGTRHNPCSAARGSSLPASRLGNFLEIGYSPKKVAGKSRKLPWLHRRRPHDRGQEFVLLLGWIMPLFPICFKLFPHFQFGHTFRCRRPGGSNCGNLQKGFPSRSTSQCGGVLKVRQPHQGTFKRWISFQNCFNFLNFVLRTKRNNYIAEIKDSNCGKTKCENETWIFSRTQMICLLSFPNSIDDLSLSKLSLHLRKSSNILLQCFLEHFKVFLSLQPNSFSCYMPQYFSFNNLIARITRRFLYKLASSNVSFPDETSLTTSRVSHCPCFLQKLNSFTCWLFKNHHSLKIILTFARN